MKRRTLKFIACAAIMALSLSVTACGGSDSGSASSTSDSTTVEDTEGTAEGNNDETEAEADVAEPEDGAEGYETLEDYINDPTVKSLLESQYSTMAEDGMSVAIEANGNEFIVVIKIEDSSMMVDGIGDALSQAMEMDEIAEVFTDAAAEFDTVIGKEGASTVTMRYTDPDDNVLAEKSYKAN